MLKSSRREQPIRVAFCGIFAPVFYADYGKGDVIMKNFEFLNKLGNINTEENNIGYIKIRLYAGYDAQRSKRHSGKSDSGS